MNPTITEALRPLSARLEALHAQVEALTQERDDWRAKAQERKSKCNAWAVLAYKLHGYSGHMLACSRYADRTKPCSCGYNDVCNNPLLK